MDLFLVISTNPYEIQFMMLGLQKRLLYLYSIYIVSTFTQSTIIVNSAVSRQEILESTRQN